MAAITVNHTRKDYDYDYRKLEKFSKILSVDINLLSNSLQADKKDFNIETSAKYKDVYFFTLE
ncbi:MAG: hypothetical protein ACI8RD_000686 [Bacillariaceae sp.]|jgi:hypothetical protein